MRLLKNVSLIFSVLVTGLGLYVYFNRDKDSNQNLWWIVAILLFVNVAFLLYTLLSGRKSGSKDTKFGKSDGFTSLKI